MSEMTDIEQAREFDKFARESHAILLGLTDETTSPAEFVAMCDSAAYWRTRWVRFTAPPVEYPEDPNVP